MQADRDLQVVLVDLVTLDGELALFQADPAGYAHQRLAGRAADALASVDAPAVARYAESLKAKRWAAVARVVPFTLKVAPSLAPRYRRWLGQHPCPGDRPPLSPGESEALRALLPMRSALLADEAEALWAADLLAFEVLRACSRRDGRVRRLASRWPIHAVVAALAGGTLPLDPDEGDHRYVFTRRGWTQ